MATSWRLSCCALFTILSVCCAIHPQQQQHRQQRMRKHQTELSTRSSITPNEDYVEERKETPRQRRVRREAVDCPVLEAQGEQGLQEILDTDGETHSFFIQPQPGFNRLLFRMKVNNKFDIESWAYAKETLDIKSSRLGIDWAHPTWIPVDVEYFKREKSFGRDRHALRVKVGTNVNEVLSTSWWRTHSYEGFTIYAEGPLKVLFKCNPKNAVAEFVTSGGDEKQILLIVCVIGVCFLLVVGVAITCFLTAGCSRTPTRDDPPPVPRLPKSLSLSRRVNRNSESDRIYETIDEDMLAKLRENLDSETLGRPQRVKDHYRGTAEGSYVGTKTSLDLATHEHCHSSKIPFGGKPGLSLLEEKEALRQFSELDSPMQSHYVEMHGIVSRTSSLNK